MADMPAGKSISRNKLSPHEKACQALSDEFLSRLGRTFGFDGEIPEYAESIRGAGQAFYIARGRSISPNFRKQDREKYIRLKQDAEKFRQILENAKETGINDDMELFASAILYGPNPDESGISDSASMKEIPRKFDALIKLNNILIAAADHGIKQLSERRGPKIDDALEVLVRRIADFWIFELNRKFTIDHHKGSGTTKSFQFLQAIIRQLGDNISDTEIVTAMRADHTARRKIERLSKKRGNA